MTTFNSKVQGIPCKIRITHLEAVPGSYSPTAASDLDYYGWYSVNFVICDMGGRPAPWLQRKATSADLERLENECLSLHH